MNTPYFIISEEELEKNIQVFKNALNDYWPNSELAYSVKTNSLPWLLQYLNKNNVMAEVVSDEEYMLALKCGFTHDRIVFNGPIKSEDLFIVAAENGAFVNVDSKREIQWFEQNITADKNIGLRININTDIFSTDDIGYSEDGFRFGFSDESGEIETALNTLNVQKNPIRIGMHLHCNSVTRSVSVYKTLAKYAARLIEKYNWQPSYIDVGGGFFGGVAGKPNADNYINEISQILEKAVDKNKTKLIVEPGSAIIGSAAELHTSVLDVKDTSHARIVTTDGSRIHIDPLWKKNRYMFTTVTAKNIDCKRQIICGYTCMDHDRIMAIENQAELSPGDKIIYHRVGAYTMTFGGPFIRYFPEVYVKNGRDIELVRSRMTVNDYYNIQSIQEKQK